MQDMIRLPKMELSMEEGRIQKWLVAEGDVVKKGHIIAEIETDKAVVELEMPQDGSIQRFLAAEGELVLVGTAIAELNSSSVQAAAVSEKAAEIPQAAPPAVSPAVSPAAPAGEAQSAQVTAYAAAAITSERIAISPAARRRARELNVDYTKLTGSGPRGRIVYRDLEAAAESALEFANQIANQPVLTTAATEAKAAVQTGQPLSKMRRTIAKRMLESVQTIPQFSIKKTVDVSQALEVKRVIQGSMAKSGIKLSFTDFLICAVAQSLNKHRSLNASFVGNPQDDSCSIVEHAAVNIGLAVSTEDGLLVPVIHNASELSVSAIARQRMAKLESVRKHTLKSADLQGGTFTISNLGMFEVDEFQAIVNPPEAGILAVGSIRQLPMLIEGKLEFRPAITLTGSFDHRVVDGAAAAEFMRSLAEQLQSDEWILM